FQRAGRRGVGGRTTIVAFFEKLHMRDTRSGTGLEPGSPRKARTPLVSAFHRPVWARRCDRRHALERLGRRRGSSGARVRARATPRQVPRERAASPAVLSTVQVSGPTGELPRRRCQATTCDTTRAEAIA